MCGTFHYNIDSDDKVSKQIKTQAEILDLIFKTGDIYPKDDILVVIPKEDRITLGVKNWGIKTSKSLLINARNETLDSTYTFSKIMNNRCAIPANWFYEWKDKRKYSIGKTDESTIFLAGIYNENNELVIITGQSENSMADIHERTPIILDSNGMYSYLHNNTKLTVDNNNLFIK